MPIRSYRDIEAYQRAKALVVPMHELAASFPSREQFDLCDQIRRASKSVTANIVEGYSHKDTPAKAKQFWCVAMGSANEMVEIWKRRLPLNTLLKIPVSLTSRNILS
jgi:four helix bundle protein